MRVMSLLEQILFQALQWEKNFIFSDKIISALKQVAEYPDSEGIYKLTSPVKHVAPSSANMSGMKNMCKMDT